MARTQRNTPEEGQVNTQQVKRSRSAKGKEQNRKREAGHDTRKGFSEQNKTRMEIVNTGKNNGDLKTTTGRNRKKVEIM